MPRSPQGWGSDLAYDHYQICTEEHRLPIIHHQWHRTTASFRRRSRTLLAKVSLPFEPARWQCYIDGHACSGESKDGQKCIRQRIQRAHPSLAMLSLGMTACINDPAGIYFHDSFETRRTQSSGWSNHLVRLSAYASCVAIQSLNRLSKCCRISFCTLLYTLPGELPHTF